MNFIKINGWYSIKEGCEFSYHPTFKLDYYLNEAHIVGYTFNGDRVTIILPNGDLIVSKEVDKFKRD